MATAFKYIFMAIVGFLVLWGIVSPMTWYNQGDGAYISSAKPPIFTNLNRSTKKDMIQTLIRQTSRWSLASLQDESPIIALLHANYGAGYLWALKDIATDTEIEQASNINIVDFEKKILAAQDQATKKVSSVCPNFTDGLDSELLRLGGDA